MTQYTGELPNYEDFMPESQNAQDEALLVKFYIKPMLDKTQSQVSGRPVHKDTEYIDIRVPGSRDSVARPARDTDRARFPRHYAAFKQRIEAPVEGTPLAEWPVISRSVAEDMSYMGIKTVEALAAVPDSNTQNYMGLALLKRQAGEWLAIAENEAPVAKLTAELEERDARIDAQAKTIEDLSKRLAAVENAAAEPSSPSTTVSEVADGSDGAEATAASEGLEAPPRRRRRVTG